MLLIQFFDGSAIDKYCSLSYLLSKALLGISVILLLIVISLTFENLFNSLKTE